MSEEEEEQKEELSRSEGGGGGGGRGRGRFSAFTLYFPFLSRSSKEIDVMGPAHRKKARSPPRLFPSNLRRGGRGGVPGCKFFLRAGPPQPCKIRCVEKKEASEYALAPPLTCVRSAEIDRRRAQLLLSFPLKIPSMTSSSPPSFS